MVYTKDKGFIPLIVKVNKNMEKTIQFSVNEPDSLWDDNQWGKEYSLNEVPESMKSEYFYRCLKSMDNNIEEIKKIALNI